MYRLDIEEDGGYLQGEQDEEGNPEGRIEVWNRNEEESNGEKRERISLPHPGDHVLVGLPEHPLTQGISGGEGKGGEECEGYP